MLGVVDNMFCDYIPTLSHSLSLSSFVHMLDRSSSFSEQSIGSELLIICFVTIILLSLSLFVCSYA